MCSSLYIRCCWGVSPGLIRFPKMATSWSIAGPLGRGSDVSRYLRIGARLTSYANELVRLTVLGPSARQAAAPLNMVMNQRPTAACLVCLTSWGVVECLFASYLKDYMCSLKINENRLATRRFYQATPKRLMTAVKSRCFLPLMAIH